MGIWIRVRVRDSVRVRVRVRVRVGVRVRFGVRVRVSGGGIALNTSTETAEVWVLARCWVSACWSMVQIQLNSITSRNAFEFVAM